jgi:proteic killer suppression protein
MSKKWGNESSKKLVMRIKQLEAAENLGIFMKVHKRCHSLTGNRKGQYAADLKHPKRLIFYACDEQANIIEETSIEPESVKAILIYEVVDYHG